MAPRSRPTTPVRRVSRGSISSHHRASLSSSLAASGAAAAAAGDGYAGGSTGISGSSNNANVGTQFVDTPLAFLTQAMGDLAYETSTLHSNLEAIDEIQTALHTFDESFSMFMYGLKMNAFCVEWPEAPGEENFERAEQRKVMTSRMDTVSRFGFRPSYTPTVGEASTVYDATITGAAAADQTYMTQDDEDAALMQRKPTTVLNVGPAKGRSVTSPASQGAPAAKHVLKSALKKPTAASGVSAGKAATAAVPPPAKAKITAVEKKRREQAAEQIIDTLPLDYRGGDPTAKQLAMRVILALIGAGDKGVRINDIVRAPELPQAKVNKCMIALVNAKQITRRSENGVVYQLDTERNPI